uniref:Sorting nexin 1 n=1 Tax=Aotus nancymaae TaxID=37293 RepID=A0A2K5DLB1_AOTNA
MASGGGGCSASERLPPPFPGPEPESEGAAGGSEPEAGDSDTEGEDIFTGAAMVSKHQSPKRTTSFFPINNGSKENGIHEEQDQEPQDLFADKLTIIQKQTVCGKKKI